MCDCDLCDLFLAAVRCWTMTRIQRIDMGGLIPFEWQQFFISGDLISVLISVLCSGFWFLFFFFCAVFSFWFGLRGLVVVFWLLGLVLCFVLLFFPGEVFSSIGNVASPPKHRLYTGSSFFQSWSKEQTFRAVPISIAGLIKNKKYLLIAMF